MNEETKPKDLLFLEATIKFLVDHPESIKIGRIVDEMGVLLTLDVHPDDMRQVIGREGNTAKAMRTLLRVVGMKSNARVNLKINEPAGSTPRPPRPMNDDRGMRDNRDMRADSRVSDDGYAN